MSALNPTSLNWCVRRNGRTVDEFDGCIAFACNDLAEREGIAVAHIGVTLTQANVMITGPCDTALYAELPGEAAQMSADYAFYFQLGRDAFLCGCPINNLPTLDEDRNHAWMDGWLDTQKEVVEAM